MKFIEYLKHKFAFHLFSIFGWVLLYEFYQMSKVDGGGIFIMFLIPIWGVILFALSIILLIEHIVNHNISNSFIINNLFYSIIWIIGLIISVIFTLFIIYSLLLLALKIYWFLSFCHKIVLNAFNCASISFSCLANSLLFICPTSSPSRAEPRTKWESDNYVSNEYSD